ncbi:OR13A protein, partial [Acromyrmex insinuator]
MTIKTTPKNAIAFIKVIIALSFSWPLSKSASKFQITCFKILRSLLCMNTVVLSIPIAYTLYRNDYDLPRITKLWCTLGAMIQVSVEMTQCALQYDRLQYLISEMEWTLERAELYEKNIYQRYVDRCAMFYVSSTAAVFLGAGIGVIVPLTAADQIFPTEAKYPFNVEHEPIKTIIFVHQFIAVWQCFSTVCIGSFVSLFIWFAAARFEILLQQFRMVTDIYDITVCVRQHIKLLRYAQEIIIAFRSVLLTIMIICTWAIVASGLTIVSQCSLTDKIQFMALCISALMEVYACAWPADRLIDTSTNVAQAVYESLWYNQDKIFQKNLNFILLRSQTPTTISVSILPPLSLQYYASRNPKYVSTAFSYLMTLRMVFMEEDRGIKN